MGLLSAIFSSPKTKAEWDEKIMKLNKELASKQSYLASVRTWSNSSNKKYNISRTQGEIASIRADIANAKLQRRNAPC